MEANKTRIRMGRIIYFVLAILFTLCVVTQFYFAGLAVFLDAAAWMKHMMFVHLFGFNVPLIMLIFAVIGALPRNAYWQLFVVLVCIFLLYFTANMNAPLPWVGPLHVIIAILLFVLSCSLVVSTWNVIRNHSERKDAK